MIGATQFVQNIFFMIPIKKIQLNIDKDLVNFSLIFWLENWEITDQALTDFRLR